MSTVHHSASSHASPSWPPPPWRLRGEAFLLLAGLSSAAPGRPRGPLALEGLLLARYSSASTLNYHELILFSAPWRRGWRTGARITRILVDSEPSLQAGREVWGLPKELARFRWGESAVEVEQGAELLCRLEPSRGSRLSLPSPLLAPFWGERDGRLLWGLGRGLARVAPVRAALQPGPGDPLGLQRLAADARCWRLQDLNLRLPAPSDLGAVSSWCD